MSDYLISQEVTTEEVAAYMGANPLVPGAIIIRNQKAGSMISRHKMFERLGHRYGVELFLQKPIGEMERELNAEAFALKSHISINMAVKLALSRTQNHIYDPIIVEFENGDLRLLDMYVLLLSQSQLSQNLSGIISSLNNIEMMLSNSQMNPTSTLELIMEGLGKVVPSHHMRVVLHPEINSAALFHHFVQYQKEPLELNSIYKSVLTMNQPIVIEDVHKVPAWSNWDTPNNTRCWLGAPISHQNGQIGLVSLSRTTFSPFTNHEKEITLVFARYLGKLFENISLQLEKRRVFEKKYYVR